jgi:hypothetical protein
MAKSANEKGIHHGYVGISALTPQSTRGRLPAPLPSIIDFFSLKCLRERGSEWQKNRLGEL